MAIVSPLGLCGIQEFLIMACADWLLGNPPVCRLEWGNKECDLLRWWNGDGRLPRHCPRIWRRGNFVRLRFNSSLADLVCMHQTWFWARLSTVFFILLLNYSGLCWRTAPCSAAWRHLICAALIWAQRACRVWAEEETLTSELQAHRESTGTAPCTGGAEGDPVALAEEIAFCRACARFGLGLYLYHEDDNL